MLLHDHRKRISCHCLCVKEVPAIPSWDQSDHLFEPCSYKSLTNQEGFEAEVYTMDVTFGRVRYRDNIKE